MIASFPHITPKWLFMKCIQAHLKDNAGAVPDHPKKVKYNLCCLQLVKKTSVKLNEAKCNKMRCACIAFPHLYLHLTISKIKATIKPVLASRL